MANLIYECKENGWVTEKECRDCFNQDKKKEYGHVKHCRRENVTSTESNDNKDDE